jgi:hypothetical protein
MKKMFLGLVALSTLSAIASEPLKKLCVNDIVITDRGQRGEVRGVFPQGDVMVKLEGHGGHFKWPENLLARTTGCIENKRLCVNDRIISNRGEAGVVAGILPENQVMVRFDGFGSYHKRQSFLLAKTKGCTPSNYCVGDIVISDMGMVGKIHAIRSGEKVMVKFEGYGGYHERPTSRLSVTEACYE